jgi:ferrochelatase
MGKIAVILFNIGGPESTEKSKIKKYLMNFFSDKFIIRQTLIVRKLIAFIISRTRYKKTKKIYDSIGGKSPVLENTREQIKALKSQLGENFDIFCSMRYWYPLAADVIDEIKDKNYDQIILLPLYPQCSSTTTVSSYEDWILTVKKNLDPDSSTSLLRKIKLICKHFDHPEYIEALTNLIFNKYLEAKKLLPDNKLQIFFSAHSIPEFLVTKMGDPYKDHLEQTIKNIVEKLSILGCEINHILTYQSKVGKIKWLEPSTEDALKIYAEQNITPIIVPIAFVSENSETLFELDIEYRELLESYGIENFFRVGTLSCDEKYINLLANLIKKASQSNLQFVTKRFCENKTDCPCVKYENIA